MVDKYYHTAPHAQRLSNFLLETTEFGCSNITY